MLFSLLLLHLLSSPGLPLRLADSALDEERENHPVLLNCLGKACWLKLTEPPHPREEFRFLKSLSVWDEEIKVCFFFFLIGCTLKYSFSSQKHLSNSPWAWVGATETCGSLGKLAQLCWNAWLAMPDYFLVADFMIIRNFSKQNFCFWMAADRLSEYKVAPVIARYTSDLLQGARNGVFPHRASLTHRIIFKLNFSSEASFLTPITLYY